MDCAGVVVARSVAGVAQLARASSGSVVQLSSEICCNTKVYQMTKQMRQPADYLRQRYDMTGGKSGKKLTCARHSQQNTLAHTHCDSVLNLIIQRALSVKTSNKTVSSIRSVSCSHGPTESC